MNTKVYACYLKNSEELRKSSSGGAFTALSNAIFRFGGCVIACSYQYDSQELQFDVAETQEKRNQMRGSKYIQAFPNNLYLLLEKELAKKVENPILVVGTPCQIAGTKIWLNAKISKEHRPVILCDLICHGVSSPVMWKEYVNALQRKAGLQIVKVSFKEKDRGWIRPTAKAWLEDSQELLIEDYAKLYRSRDFMRPSCYACKFAKQKRDTDLTIGDFWNIQNAHPTFANMEGTSNVFVHTKLGKWLFQQAMDELIILESTQKDCIQPALQYPCAKTKRYEDIHKDYERFGIDYIIERYIHFGPGNILVRKMRRKLLELRYKEK